MNPDEFVALIIGIFFVVGMIVGLLAVMAIPSLVSFLAFRTQQFRVDPTERLDTGPPPSGPGWPGGPDLSEPDDRDDPRDGPWWRDAG
jgi:hypothetical protein